MDNSDKTIISLCGGSGAWERPYVENGYNVINVTLPDYDILLTYFTKTRIFFKGVNSEWLEVPKNGVYGILAAPPCTKFSKASWSIKKKDRDFESGMKVVRQCMNIIWTIQEAGAPLKFWALENPMGYLYNFMGYPHFYFQPWMFGETGFLATKRTALWGYFKKPIKTVRKRTIPFISPHSQSKGTIKENKPWYSASAEQRAATPPGFATAFYRANK